MTNMQTELTAEIARYQDGQHFKAWCEGRRLRLDTRRAMWQLFISDRDYWADRGWPAVLQAVSADDRMGTAADAYP
jgi:hypothetical protein